MGFNSAFKGLTDSRPLGSNYYCYPAEMCRFTAHKSLIVGPVMGQINAPHNHVHSFLEISVFKFQISKQMLYRCTCMDRN